MKDESRGAAAETVDIPDTQEDPFQRPTPHGDKLIELVKNPKLPEVDRPRVEELRSAYDKWIRGMSQLNSTGDVRVKELVELLNDYKRKIELDLIWDSEEAFLYRQKGQLKLDNTVLEEWFPWLVDPAIMPELEGVDLSVGPAKAFSAAHFGSVLTDNSKRPALKIRSKDQDFTIGRPTYMRASFTKNFEPSATDERETYIAYIAAELKTNLDKTMFQEATATSHDLTVAAPGSHYFLICEYLDMTPISSAGTDIEQVLVLRGKRIGSDKRKSYASPTYRKENREMYKQLLDSQPIRTSVVQHFVDRVREILKDQGADLSDAVERGYF